MQSKNALSNLKNRYMAVLKKCNLLNVFGSLAVVSALSIGLVGNVNTAFADVINPENSSIPIMNATDYGDPILTNNGTITGSDVSGLIHGMYGNHSSVSISYIFINNDLISIDYTAAASASVYGMFAGDRGNHILTNNDTITATATGVTTNTSSAFANVRGMNATGTGNHTLTNSGTITATATGGTSESSSAYANVHGMNATGTGNHTLTNSGTITATATGGTSESSEAYAYAYGMEAQDIGNRTLTNSGTITATATGGTAESSYAFAHGMRIFDATDSEVTNSNAITVTATGGTSKSSSASASAYGMHIVSDGNNKITNSGTITVTATGGTSESSHASASAYGMYLGSSTNTLLNNFGTINVSASVQKDAANARTYEAYGSSFTVGTWATTLRDWSANDAVFGLYNGRTITFGEGSTGATLILRADDRTVFGEEYYVANMVAIDDVQQMQFETGKIEGSIAEVKTEVDFLTANLNNSDLDNPTVSLSLNLSASDFPTQAITGQSLNGNLAHIAGVNDVTKNAIANVYNRAFGFEEVVSADSTGLSAGSTKINPWTVFATTYGSYTDNNEYNYNSGSFGVTGGITYNFNEQFALGGHLNFNIANSDSSNFDSDSNSFAFGAHSQYFINPNWYVSGSASFAFGDSDVEYTQPIGVAKDEFSSFSAFASLSTGYVYEINQNNIIVPEIGLSYLHAENDSYSLDFGAGNEIYKFDMHNNSYDNLYADLSLTWQGNYNLSSSTLSPSVGVGIRQNLTASDIDASYDLLNTRFDTTVSSDDTTFLANAGLKWTKDNFTVSADYEGEFGNEQTSHTGSLNFTYKF